MIQNRAMLAQFTVNQWTARKQDKKVTKEVESAHGAHDAGRFNKDLVSKDLLSPISKHADATRAEHYKLTLAWNDNGQRMLPSKLFMDYTTMMRTARAEFQRLVRAMILKYPAEVQAARNRLGSMYDPADYPDVNDLQARFNMDAEFAPVPVANDFRVDVGDEAVQEIKANITHNMVLKQAKAVEATYARIRDVVSKVEERLSDPKAIFKDSLITNVTDLVKVLDGLNITDDPMISTITGELNYLAEPPSQLRTNLALREAVANRASAILQKLP